MNERMQILNMLSEGKITADEANTLLWALDDSDTNGPEHTPRWLRIRVTEEGMEKVKVNLPISLARMGLALLPDAAMVQINRKGIDLDQLLDENLQAVGKIIDIEDGANKVEVFVE